MTTTAEQIVDLVAVQRVIDGRAHHHTLNLDEKRYAAHLLTADGYSAHDIATRLGVAPRSVTRWRTSHQMPAAYTEQPERWQEQALCREYDVLLFFPPEDDGRLQSYSEAKAICAACPVRALCLEAAMTREGNAAHHFRAGVWGGLTPNQRGALAAVRRKEAAA